MIYNYNNVLMVFFSDAKFLFLKLLMVRKQRTESTLLIRRSVRITIQLHQRQSRTTLPPYNKAKLLIYFALNLLIKK